MRPGKISETEPGRVRSIRFGGIGGFKIDGIFNRQKLDSKRLVAPNPHN